MRNITGNSPIFLPSVTRKAAAKVLIFSETRIQRQYVLTFFIGFKEWHDAVYECLFAFLQVQNLLFEGVF